MPHDLPDDMIGGGVVRRRIGVAGGDGVLAGTRLTREQVLAMPVANRRAMISTGHISVWPLNEQVGGERFAVHLGFGKYDVVEGRKLNAEPLTKEQAEALAGIAAAASDAA
jgi:hypothetical protein